MSCRREPMMMTRESSPAAEDTLERRHHLGPDGH
jgi:hypothetical protein